MTKIADGSWVLRLEPAAGAKALLVHFQLCEVRGHDRLWIGDAVFLGATETAREFLAANAETRLFPDADYALCQPPGFQLRRVGDQTSSSTRALLHMGGLIRYLLLHQPDAERGADLLRASARAWRDTLRERDESRDLNSISLSLRLVEACFPFDALEMSSVGEPTRAAARELVESALYLRRKLQAFDPAAEKLVRRDERLLARLSAR